MEENFAEDLIKEDIKEDNSNKKNNSINFMSKIKKNPWILATLLLGIVAILSLYVNFNGKITGNVISGGDAGSELVEYLNAQTGGGVEYLSYKDLGNIYEVTVSYEGQNLPVFITKDGGYFVQGAVPLTGEIIGDNTPSQQQTPQYPETYSKGDLSKIKEFSQCLADNGVKAYGAGWCGYCKQLKEAFGGEEQISPFYIECQNADRTPTEYTALCEQEQITGFPTIKINGKPYSGARTIEGLASAIDACNAPKLGDNDEESDSCEGEICDIQLTSYSLSDVSEHDTESNCWVSYGGNVYDITEFLSKHKSPLGKYCGTGQEFEDAYMGKHKGSKDDILSEYKIGNLK